MLTPCLFDFDCLSYLRSSEDCGGIGLVYKRGKFSMMRKCLKNVIKSIIGNLLQIYSALSTNIRHLIFLFDKFVINRELTKGELCVLKFLSTY